MVEFREQRELQDYNPTDSEPLDPKLAWKEPYRDRGLLTETDRKYLLGRIELEGQDERNARYRIRQRVIHGIHDIRLLTYALSDNDLEQIVNNKLIEHHSSTDLMLFAYRMLELQRDDPLDAFEGQIEQALQKALKVKRSTDNVTISIDADVDISISEIEYDLRNIYSKLKRGEATREEFWHFMQNAEPNIVDWSDTDEETVKFRDNKSDEIVEFTIRPRDLKK